MRDASVNGRVVAAVSPTLYAPAAGTVTLKVKRRRHGEAGDVLAELDSPDLTTAASASRRRFAQLEAEVGRASASSPRKQKLLAQRDADEAEIERVAAQRVYERIEKAGFAGVIARSTS